MIIEHLVAPLFQANTYIIAPRSHSQALVVDPGHGHVEAIRQTLQRYDLEVGAVLCTHGHADHIWDSAQVAGDKPVWVPEPDLYRMDNPIMERDMINSTLYQMVDSPYVKPSDVRALPSSSIYEGIELVEGVFMKMVLAPGHTEGSALFLFDLLPVDDRISQDDNSDGTQTASHTQDLTWCEGNCSEHIHGPHVALSADVIFAGSVGRTDLHGGDQRQMNHSLRTLMNVIHPETTLLPGHGRFTTMGHENSTNPYMLQARHIG